MMDDYKIADLTVRMETFGRTAVQAKPYRLEGAAQPQVVLAPDWRALQAQQPHLSDEDSAYIATAGAFYCSLLGFDGMMLHASAVVVDGRAYLFSAPSGTGKSTHTALWLQQFGSRAYILNDDKPALRLLEGQWYAYGTPWSGKHDLSTNARVPLAGICILHRGQENVIRPMPVRSAIPAILEQTLRPADAQQRLALLELLDRLLTQVPVWELSCNMEPEAARLSYEAMSGSGKGREL